MKKSEETKKEQKKVAPKQIKFFNPEKIKKEENYNRKHTKVDKHKDKGKNKINLRSERSQY